MRRRYKFLSSISQVCALLQCFSCVWAVRFESTKAACPSPASWCCWCCCCCSSSTFASCTSPQWRQLSVSWSAWLLSLSLSSLSNSSSNEVSLLSRFYNLLSFVLCSVNVYVLVCLVCVCVCMSVFHSVEQLIRTCMHIKVNNQLKRITVESIVNHTCSIMYNNKSI